MLHFQFKKLTKKLPTNKDSIFDFIYDLVVETLKGYTEVFSNFEAIFLMCMKKLHRIRKFMGFNIFFLNVRDELSFEVETDFYEVDMKKCLHVLKITGIF